MPGTVRAGTAGAKSVQDTPSTSKADASQGEGASTKEPPSRTLYTAMAHTGMCADDELTAKYYVDSGASEHLIPSKVYLRSYREFDKPVEIAVADDGQILLTALDIYGLRLVNGQEREIDLEDVYYAPRVHERLLSMGKLEDQGWDVRPRMELRGRNGDLFTDIVKTNKVYQVELRSVASRAELAGWTTDTREGESTYQELLERLGKVAMTATVRGGSHARPGTTGWVACRS